MTILDCLVIVKKNSISMYSFSFKEREELKKIGIQAFKIGSEMTDIPSLKKIAKFNLPMIVSTGMSTSDEIRETYIEILKINKKASSHELYK